MRCVTAAAPFTREELLARGVSPEAADELLLFAAKLVDRHRRRHALHAQDERERDPSPHRFAATRQQEAL